MHLWGIPELDFEILLLLDANSLLNACVMNYYIAQICNDNYFWKLKVKRDFGLWSAQYKPLKEHYKTQYQTLLQIATPREAIMKQRPDALVVYLEKYSWLNMRDLNLAAEIGNLKILELLASYNLYPDQEGAGAAAENGDFETLRWLAHHNIFPDSIGANICAKEGHLHILKWLAQYNIFPTSWGANFAHRYNHVDVVNWLSYNGIHTFEVPL